MARPDFLDDPPVQRWLDGVEPAWTLLTFEGMKALVRDLPQDRASIHLAADLAPEEIAACPIARSTLVLLQQAVEQGGLAMTKTGNLTRAVVADMRARIDWPDFDQAHMDVMCKVVNEPDFLPLYTVRLLAQPAGLVRKRRDRLHATPLGRAMLAPSRQGALAALLLELALWQMNLSWFREEPLGMWPQDHVGIVLWSLSVAAGTWQTPARLMRLCTMPHPLVPTETEFRGTSAMVTRILQPLTWFGLLDHRLEPESEGKIFGEDYYRKTPLFDRMVRFEVEMEGAAGARH